MSKLRIPLEPKPLKKYAQNEEKKLEKQGLDKEAIMVVLWSDSPYRKLPSLLWNEWRSPLKEQGMQYQDFEKVISECKFDLYDWVKEKLSWEELILKIQEKIEEKYFKSGRMQDLVVFAVRDVFDREQIFGIETHLDGPAQYKKLKSFLHKKYTIPVDVFTVDDALRFAFDKARG